jgi:hypothetical protein
MNEFVILLLKGEKRMYHSEYNLCGFFLEEEAALRPPFLINKENPFRFSCATGAFTPQQRPFSTPFLN